MNKLYIVIYTEENGIINGIEQTLKSYNIPNNRSKYNSINQIEYQDDLYSLNLYITRNQIETLYKNGIKQTRESNIKHQFVEIELLSELSNRNLSKLGLPQIIKDAIIKSISKPIYHISTLDENEMGLLKENPANQFINRYDMAKYIDTNPTKIDEQNINHTKKAIECFIMDNCSLDKSLTTNSKLAWFSIGEKIGEDGWGMTALQFIPIDFQQYKTDLKKLNYNEEITTAFLNGVTANSNILRLEYERKGESCSYLIENSDEFIYNRINRIY
jgi:hypothetical protein